MLTNVCPGNYWPSLRAFTMDFIQMLSASCGNRQGEIIVFVKGSHGAKIDFPSRLLGAKWVFWIKLMNSSLKKGRKRRGGERLFTNATSLAGLGHIPVHYYYSETSQKGRVVSVLQRFARHWHPSIARSKSMGLAQTGTILARETFLWGGTGGYSQHSCSGGSGFKLFLTDSFFLQRSTPPTF